MYTGCEKLFFLLLFEIDCMMNVYSPTSQQTANSKEDNTETRLNHNVVLVIVG